MKKTLFVFLLLGFAAATARAATVYTDESLKEIFESPKDRQTHGVMADQMDRLHAVQRAFLLGDTETIRRVGAEIADAMQGVSRVYSQQDRKSSKAWVAMAGIVAESEDMRAMLDAGDYGKAYGHYSDLMARCIQCHQASRDWGVFTEPPSEEKAPAAAPEEGVAVLAVPKAPAAPAPAPRRPAASETPAPAPAAEGDEPA